MQALPTLQEPPENHHGVGHSNTPLEKGALAEGGDGSECDGVSTGVPHAHLLHDALLSPSQSSSQAKARSPSSWLPSPQSQQAALLHAALAPSNAHRKS